MLMLSRVAVSPATQDRVGAWKEFAARARGGEQSRRDDDADVLARADERQRAGTGPTLNLVALVVVGERSSRLMAGLITSSSPSSLLSSPSVPPLNRPSV